MDGHLPPLGPAGGKEISCIRVDANLSPPALVKMTVFAITANDAMGIVNKNYRVMFHQIPRTSGRNIVASYLLKGLSVEGDGYIVFANLSGKFIDVTLKDFEIVMKLYRAVISSTSPR